MSILVLAPSSLFTLDNEYLEDLLEKNLTFIGCTGIGIPNMHPVATLKIPVKTSVVPKLMDSVMAKPNMSGSNVPRSPRAPESSDMGDDRSVLTFRLVLSLKLAGIIILDIVV